MVYVGFYRCGLEEISQWFLATKQASALLEELLARHSRQLPPFSSGLKVLGMNRLNGDRSVILLESDCKKRYVMTYDMHRDNDIQ